MSHPETRGRDGQCIPFPVLYEEKKFISSINRDEYLFRQAGSAVYLCNMYRQWLRQAHKGENFYWRCALVGPLLHLIRVHELQGNFDVVGKLDSVVERRSWYIDQMFKITHCTQVNNGLRLAIMGVMYLRGHVRYRQLVEANFGHPYTIWIRDAELNARLCFDVLEDMEDHLIAETMLKEAVEADASVIKMVEEKK